MPTLSHIHPTLIAILWPTRKASNGLRLIALVVIGMALLTVSAKLHVPFWPVPMTMQTFVVLVLGMAYGWRLGAVTVLAYLVEGAFGLPVFSGTPERGIGLAYMMGPTGGYLVGFVAAAAATGWLAERGWDRHPVSTALAMVVGNLLIYILGVAWLMSLIGPEKAFKFGLVPFLLGDGLKILLATAILPGCWWLLRRRNGAG